SFGGKIVGLVTDASTAVGPRASITITNEGTGAQRRMLTDASGVDLAAELPVGSCTGRLEAPGTGGAEGANRQADLGSEHRADASLSAREMEQPISVSAEAPDVQLESSALADVVGTRQVGELPLNGRDFRRLAFLVPGSAPRWPRGSLGSFTANGQLEKSNIF